MTASPTQLRRSIEPGSVPQGQRQVLERRLGQLGGGQAPVSPRAATAPSNLGIPSNPLDPLVSGELGVANDEVTAGLPVGPGPGPLDQNVPDSRVERLRMVALQARSPVLRELARRALRSTVRSRRVL